MPQASNICFSILQRIAGKPSPISYWIMKFGKISNDASCKSNFPTDYCGLSRQKANDCKQSGRRYSRLFIASSDYSTN